MRLQVIIEIPDAIAVAYGSAPVVKRAAKTGIITEFLATFRQAKGIRGQSRDADRFLVLLRESVVIEEVK